MRKLVIATLIPFLSYSPTISNAASSNAHVVINEIEISGSTNTDEFVELYNSSTADVSLLHWKLVRRTALGSQSNLVTSFPNISLPAHTYFLVTHPTGYTGTTKPDLVYSTSASLAENNAVLLMDSKGTIVDQVGFGSSNSSETSPAPNPPAKQSISRTMIEMLAIDSDNNASDFSISTIPTPEHSAIINSSPPDYAPSFVFPPPSSLSLSATMSTQKISSNFSSPPKKPPSPDPLRNKKITNKLPAPPKEITVTGIVTAEPGSIAKHSFYITQVEGADTIKNLRIDSLSLLDKKTFSLGKRVKARGKLHKPSTGPYLALTDTTTASVANTDNGSKAPDAIDIANADPTHDLEGLVTAHGKIIQKNGRSFKVTLDNNDDIQVALPLGIPMPYPKDTELTVTGILTQNNTGLRLLLRSLDDIEVTPLPPDHTPSTALPKATTHLPLIPVVAINAVGLSAAAGYFLWRKRKPQVADLDIDIEDA